MPLTIISYNILLGYDPEVWRTISRLAQQADILLLQEVRALDKSDKTLQRLREMFHDWYLIDFVDPQGSLNNLGLVTISKVKPISVEKIHLSKPKKELLNVQSYFLKELPQHGALVTTYKTGDKVFRVTNLHLDIGGGYQHKRKHFSQLAEVYKTLAPEADYDVVAGDFNTTGRYKARDEVPKVLIQCIKPLGDGFKIVPNSDWTSDVEYIVSPLLPLHRWIHICLKFFGLKIRQRLDWVVVRGAKVKELTVLKDMKGSDHFPLKIVVESP